LGANGWDLYALERTLASPRILDRTRQSIDQIVKGVTYPKTRLHGDGDEV